MDFGLSDELIMLRDGVERFIQDEYDFDKRRDHLDIGDGFSRVVWGQMAELGWLAAAMPEEVGGSALGPHATMVVMEGMGRGLAVEPYLCNIVMAGELISRYGNKQQKTEILSALAVGECMATLAHAEPGGRYDLFHIATTAHSVDAKYRLSGLKGLVLNAATADKIIIPARTSGNVRDLVGISLFLVDAKAEGLSLRSYRTYDGMQASELILENVLVENDALIGNVGEGLSILEDIMDRAIAALCAEAVGAMDVLFNMTLDYLKERKQFGRPISNFQASQFRMADMFMSLENAKSMAAAATIAVDGDDVAHRRREVAAAKIQINEAAHLIGRQGAQLHGAIAITDELPAAHYYKRLSAIEALFGNTDYHLGRYAEDVV